MTYTKPTNITITQMAQWVDTNGSKSDCDQELLCQYIYHIVIMKCKKFGMFPDPDQTDDFALYCTYRLITRLQKQHEQIKSVMNYVKNILPLWKSDYIREFMPGSPDNDVADFNLFDFSDYLVDITSEDDYYRYNLFYFNACKIIRKHIEKIPRRKNSSEWSNIYTSCLLTLNNRLNFAAKLLTEQKNSEDPEKINWIIRKLKNSPPILYHVSEDLTNYVQVLVNEATHALAVEITADIGSRVSASECLRNLVIAASSQSEDD